MKIKNLILTVAILFSLNCQAQDFSQVRIKLETISDSSLLIRKNVMPIMKKYGANSLQMDSLNSIIIKHDSMSLKEVTFLLGKYGWLGVSQIGDKANLALFLTMQHAQDNQIREKYFPLLEASAKEGESNLANMATMKDRILVENGKEQIYGTQSEFMDGERVVLPIWNSKNVNKRRKKVGLERIHISQNTPN